jgi:hypothetical protein
MRSTIDPRGASRRTVLSWLFRAAFSYFVPERIWSDQSRRKRTAKTASAIVARIATRNAIFGVKRYGSSTRGSRGRKRPALVAVGLAHDEAREAVDGPGQDQVEGDPLEERRPEHHSRRGGLAEDEVEGERADRVEEGDHADRDEGGMRAVAAGRLAVPAGPVAGDREQQGRDAERLQVRGVEQQAAPEPRQGADDRAAQERDADDRHEQEIGRPVQDRHARED